MNRTLRHLLLCAATLASVAIGWASPAAAACAITLRNVAGVNFTSSGAYPVFAATDTGKSVAFQVRHPNGQATCSYFVTFSKGGATTYSNRRMILSGTELRYQIYNATQTAILKDVPDATLGEVIAGAFSTTALVTHDLTYYISIPALQVVAANTYVDNVVVRLFEGTPTSYVQRDSVTIQVRGQTIATTQVCVGCVASFDTAAHSHELNFGNLDTGEVKTGTVRVRSNDGYSLSLQSTNRSVLRHTSLSSTVAYTATVNGVGVVLTGTSAVQVAHVPGVTTATGTTYNVQITIGSVAGKLAGNYTDYITVTVTGY